MRIFMRFLLTVYLLAIIIISGVVLACDWNIIQTDFPQYWISLLYTDSITRFLVSVIGVLLIIISITLMFYGIRKRKPKTTLIKDTGLGAISISLSAVEEMAARHITSNKFIKSAKVFVRIKDMKADFTAKLSITEGANIPEVLSSLQTSLKENIEVLSGVVVNTVLMEVEKTSQIVKSRVE